MEPAPTDHHGARRASAGAGIVVLRLVLAIAIGRLSQQVPLNSDQASSVLEGWAMAHGNVLLSGWTLPSDSFFTDKLPLLALLERFQGFVSGVVTVSTHGAITVRAVSTTSTSLTPFLWHTTVAGTTIMVWPGNVLGDLSPP